MHTFPILSSASVLKGKTIHKLKTNSQGSINELIQSIVSSNPNCKEPFYILDLGTVIDLYQKWTHHLPFIQPYYAVKCNPDHALVGTLAALGASFDCASRTEIESILSLNVGSDRIIYANPCKDELNIKYAMSVGVNITTFDSVYELQKLNHHHPSCSLLLRIRPPHDKGVLLSLGSKYGALPEEITDLLQEAKSMNLPVVGVSFHVGTFATVYDIFDDTIEYARTVFDLASSLGGLKMHILDIGGGFVAGHLFEEAATVIKSSIERHFGDWSPTAHFQIIAEPGRYFAATALTLVTCIIGKRVRGEIREYWINDGIFGSMGCAYTDGTNVPFIPLRGISEATKTYASTVFGQTCHSFDVVRKGIQLPEMEVGDWLVSPEMGAYTKSVGTSFNGFSTAGIPVHLANSVAHMNDLEF